MSKKEANYCHVSSGKAPSCLFCKRVQPVSRDSYRGATAAAGVTSLPPCSIQETCLLKPGSVKSQSAQLLLEQM